MAGTSCGMPVSRSRFNVVAVGAAFAVLFSAYNTLQSYATSLLGALGNQSLALLYVVCAVSVFAAPALCAWAGARLTMFIGAACYVVYLASMIVGSAPLILAMSAVIGFGSALLWVAVGVFITQNSTPATYATNTGIFWSIFQVNNIVGNLVTWAVFQNLSSNTPLFIGFTAVGAAGTACLLVLRKPEQHDGEGARQRPRGLRAAFAEAGVGAWNALKLLRTKEMLLLLPIFFFSGLELSFWTGAWPLLLQPTSIGLVLTFAGVGEVVGGWASGIVSDKAGRSVALLLGAALYLAGLGLTCAMRAGTALGTGCVLGGAPLASFFAALCFGLADATFNSSSYAQCSSLFKATPAVPADAVEGAEGESAALLSGVEGGVLPLGRDEAAAVAPVEDPHASVGAFTVFQLLQNAGSALWYGVDLWLPVAGAGSSYTQIYIQVALLAVAAAAYVALDLSVRRSGKA